MGCAVRVFWERERLQRKGNHPSLHGKEGMCGYGVLGKGKAPKKGKPPFFALQGRERGREGAAWCLGDV